MTTEEVNESRVLVLAPRGRDAVLAAEVITEAGLGPLVCADGAALLAAMEEGAGAAVIAQEVLTTAFTARLAALLGGQPAWSDLPMVILTAHHASATQNRRATDVFKELGNVTVLERPVHPSTLVSAVRAALRGRGRQYRSRAVLEQREREVRQRDQFLAMLGHELRNPLAAIMNAKELVDRLAVRTPPMQRPLAIIDRQMGHLHQLVDDLLDVARVTSGKIVLKLATVDLVPLVRAVVDELTRSSRRDCPPVTLSVPAEPVLVTADAVRIEQVVTNIVTNALKYTPAGGRVEIVVVTDAQGRARLLVRDTGVGISPEVLPSVFEPFTQADRTLDRAQGGMGLGLTVARRLAQLHGGDVTAVSEGLGLGSTFIVELPLAVARAPSLAPAATPEVVAAVTGPRHVLIVEDNADIRESLTELLEGLGHRVQVAADGEQALEAALAARPEVALIDIGLPRLDGYEVARRIRSALGEGIALIALTGYGQPEDRARALGAGFDLHLTKPVEIEALDQILARHPDSGCGGRSESHFGLRQREAR